jgi:F0F1-type ATP synthase epsilon subunit
MDNDKITVKIASPEEILWQGEAFSVSSKNSQGNFDILPHHANFITIIENQPVVVRDDEQQKLFEKKFRRALIYNHENKVSVYAHV